MIPWARHEKARVIIDEEQGVRSYKKDEHGRYTRPYIKFDLMNDVPMFPRERGALDRELCEQGYEREIRMAEEMDPIALEEVYQDFLKLKAKFEAWSAGNLDATKAIAGGDADQLAGAASATRRRGDAGPLPHVRRGQPRRR